jgi:hypothetical protein
MNTSVCLLYNIIICISNYQIVTVINDISKVFVCTDKISVVRFRTLHLKIYIQWCSCLVVLLFHVEIGITTIISISFIM